jgi:hypothetical protein
MGFGKASTASSRQPKREETNMGLFYSISDRELLEIRNKLFLEKGVPALLRNGFIKSPFSTAWFGRNNLNDFTYELCRLETNSQLEIITVHISRGDKWIKAYLNIFNLKPVLKNIEQLRGIEGVRFALPPNRTTEMRLRNDDWKGIPLFHMLWGKQHKIGSYYSKNGLNRRVKELGELLDDDFNNIDGFVKRWQELHRSILTTWGGHQIDGNQ